MWLQLLSISLAVSVAASGHYYIKDKGAVYHWPHCMTRARISNIAGVSHVQAELIYREKQTIILTKLLAAPQEIRDEIQILFAWLCL